MEEDNVMKLSSHAKRRVPELIKELDHLLTEGVITEDYVLGNKFLNCGFWFCV
jgi:hypothetical protein